MSYRSFAIILAISFGVFLVLPAMMPAQAQEGWGDFRSVLIPGETDEEPNAGTQNFQISGTAQDTVTMTRMEYVECDPGGGAENRNCEVKNLIVQTTGTYFQNYTDPKPGAWINGQLIKLSLSCDPNYCMFANPTLINCVNLAAQSQVSGKTLQVKFNIKNTSQGNDRIARLQNGESTSFQLGSDPLLSMSCTLK